MMLRHPETVVAELLGMARKVAGMAERDTGIGAFGNRGEVEN